MIIKRFSWRFLLASLFCFVSLLGSWALLKTSGSIIYLFVVLVSLIGASVFSSSRQSTSESWGVQQQFWEDMRSIHHLCAVVILIYMIGVVWLNFVKTGTILAAVVLGWSIVRSAFDFLDLRERKNDLIVGALTSSDDRAEEDLPDKPTVHATRIGSQYIEPRELGETQAGRRSLRMLSEAKIPIEPDDRG